MLDGSHSVFGPEPMSAETAHRCSHLDLHPTGPLWGAGDLRSRGVVREIEADVVARAGDLADGLARAGLKQERRSLRLAVRDLVWRWLDADLELGFFLPAGSYATVVLQALGDCLVPAPLPDSPGDRAEPTD